MPNFTGTPRTWSTGEDVTADMMNGHVRDPILALSGPWSAISSPTVTGWSIGNGSLTGSYMQVGKLVACRYELTFGSTTSPAGLAYLALPVTPIAQSASAWGLFYDASTTVQYQALAFVFSGSALVLAVPGTNGVRVAPSSTIPFTWAAGDIVRAGCIYEAA